MLRSEQNEYMNEINIELLDSVLLQFGRLNMINHQFILLDSCNIHFPSSLPFAPDLYSIEDLGGIISTKIYSHSRQCDIVKQLNRRMAENRSGNATETS